MFLFHNIKIMKTSIVLFLFIITISLNRNCNGQNLPDSTKTLRIETRDGNIFIGSVVAEDSLTLVLKTEHLGEIEIPWTYIKSTTRLKEVKEVGGAIWLPNPQSSRYYWAPNGYGLEKGTSYYQNIWILYNQFSAGITNNFSIGAGMLPLFLFAGASTPLWIVPKFSIPVVENKVNIGTGAFLGTILGEQTGLFGLLYGTTTFGSRDKNISVGLAYGFADDQWQKAPVINVSSLIRTGPKAYFITENYVITIDQKLLVLISAGGRSIIRNIGLDYSLWIPIGSVLESFVAIPFLGVTIPIGKKN
jgi:hypothetical protein